MVKLPVKPSAGGLPRVAIMQPYFFPYIGYFNLIQASDLFVFYDDVNYIRRGWINRNTILSQQGSMLFTVPVSRASPNRLIKDVSVCADSHWKNKFYRQLMHSYKKAPFFNSVIDVVFEPLDGATSSVADLAIRSITSVYRYLGVDYEHTRSSVCSPQTQGMEKADRLIAITRDLGFHSLVSAPGGKALYKKGYFKSQGVELSFIETPLVGYAQYDDTFVPWLSIIDALMFCSKKRVIELINYYNLS